MSDRERLDQIELYIIDMESSVSELMRDQSKMRLRIEKIESELVEIKIRLDKTLTHDAFDHVINALLDRLSELTDLRKSSRKHDTDIQRVETKLDNLEAKVDNLEVRFDNLEVRFDKLEAKVDNLELKMEKGFAMMFQEIQKLHK
ncbi:MAG: hypothetical protein EAZ14_04265 [Runella slithyformis]|nr:MAG: hypothetical protein EAZ80_04090 [Runella slithyformis]TAF97502.1 MAG: hypothetical protein EAZ46_02075 [Runella sp.]TAG22424.1 MAG: hypothetical protein EAZ38_05810 [Cytophagales bacterium]TAG41454.1 MAG: hypothetical protein EAZ32_02995 [Cytophagia bacterium]TAG83292.1 MAG: hypothetical protein EAZ22_03385 [Cytophagales bacterium]